MRKIFSANAFFFSLNKKNDDLKEDKKNLQQETRRKDKDLDALRLTAAKTNQESQNKQKEIVA